MSRSEPLSGLVLVGGQSRRFGRDKAALQLWGPHGPTLLEAVVARLAVVCQEVLVVDSAPRHEPPGSARLVLDRYPGGGALGAVYTGLAAAAQGYALAVAVDMPLLNPELLAYMAGRPRDYDVLIPRRSPRAGEPAHLEPLHAIYGRPCLEPMRELLERGRRRIIDFFPQVRVRYLDPASWRPLDPAGLSFRNINTPQDLQEIRDLLATRKGG
ncbi:MAG: molybdenum cofactor guanylyltransferase [Chloroflexia bacterium]|nr:molybdenum cofactor guanylyltransferase [Chloroflexia bacterium]